MDRYLLVYREVLLAHHELQVVDDHVVDVVHVDGVLHGVQHRPVGGAVIVIYIQYWPLFFLTDIKYLQILIFDIDINDINDTDKCSYGINAMWLIGNCAVPHDAVI